MKVIREWSGADGRHRRVVEKEKIVPRMELPPGMVVMSPKDLTTKQQGDDDGDIVAVSTDPRVLELFENKSSQRILHIEPEKQARCDGKGNPIASDSPEGLDYLAGNKQGPVGWVTVARAKLLAAGLQHQADALSVAVQECIDVAKGAVAWTNYGKASNPNNWETRADGEHYIGGPLTDLESPEFPMERVGQWVNAQLIRAGCFYIDRKQDPPAKAAKNPLWWRGEKTVEPAAWEIPATDHQYIKFENLVHKAARKANALWNEFAEPMLGEMGAKSIFPLGNVLTAVLTAHGLDIRPQKISNEEYFRLKQEIGLDRLTTALESQLTRYTGGPDNERKSGKSKNSELIHKEFAESAALAVQEGRFTLQDQINCWYHAATASDCSDTLTIYWACWAGSPVFEVLGISSTKKICEFLTPDRLEKTISMALQADDPFAMLKFFIDKGTQHQKEITIDGEGIPLDRCPHCMQVLADQLVHRVRLDKQSTESLWLMKLYGKVRD